MASINRAAIASAATHDLLGGEPAPHLHPSVQSANKILTYLASQGDNGADLAQLQHHTGLGRETCLQYTRLLAELGKLQIHSEGQGGKNLYSR